MDEARALTGSGVSEFDADEEEDAARDAARDPKAFGAIYERHRTTVYRYLRSRTDNDDEAGELSAVTFERALGAIERFKPAGGGMAAWLLRIARNAHIDATRRQSVRTARNDNAEPAITRHGGSPLEDDAILRSLVDALPPDQRDAIQLRFAAGLTAREIGAVLGLTEAAAQKQVERGLSALREAFRDD
jgi:RNA polymerase sigma-70 factor (ECF subfamily)